MHRPSKSLNPPKISVLMPVWNGEEYLSEAIDSILAQTLPDFELLVIDDGSTDSTPAILASYGDPRLKTFRLEHAGIVSALNYGIASSKAEWIARHDSDDISHPDRLARQWAAVEQNEQAVLCHTQAQFFGSGSTGISVPRFPRTLALLGLKLCFQCPIIHSSVMFRKEAVSTIGGYDPNERHAEDFGLWGRLLEKGDFLGLDTPLLNFRIHPESISHQKRETQIELTRKIGTSHCSRFMRLTPEQSQRAYDALTAGRHSGNWHEWSWFLRYCLPRLRWKSTEMFAWVSVQSARMILRTLKKQRVR